MFGKKDEFSLTLKQYECKECKLKFYINTEDYTKGQLKCPDCTGIANNIRIFQSTVYSIVSK